MSYGLRAAGYKTGRDPAFVSLSLRAVTRLLLPADQGEVTLHPFSDLDHERRLHRFNSAHAEAEKRCSPPDCTTFCALSISRQA